MKNWRKFRFSGTVTAALLVLIFGASLAVIGCGGNSPDPVPDKTPTTTTYTLTITIDPEDSGTVTRSPSKTSYNAGETVTVKAAANTDYKFIGWSGASTAKTESVTITMDGNKTLTAKFEAKNVTKIPDDKVRIYVDKKTNQFMVTSTDGDPKRIWINGINTPWNSWNDFGGSYNNTWWDSEFTRLKNAGINATRIWINCNGYGSITISATGSVTGASNNHWSHLDQLFNLATKHKIYIMATLTSFDHYKSGNYQSDRWRAMLRSQANARSFGDNYVKTFLDKYKDNPYLWSIDLMNEPEWVSVDEGDNIAADRIAWADLQYFFAYNASVIHANSDVLVTVGIASTKYNGGDNQKGNKLSDTALKGQYNTGDPCLDFWSPHYYSWVGQWYGVPHYLKPSGNRQGNSSNGYSGGWGLDGSKPAILGECSARGTGAEERGWIASDLRPTEQNSITTDFEYAYKNDWQGVMPWTSNCVDGNGGLDLTGTATDNEGNTYEKNSPVGEATRYMETKYLDLVYPLGK